MLAGRWLGLALSWGWLLFTRPYSLARRYRRVDRGTFNARLFWLGNEAALAGELVAGTETVPVTSALSIAVRVHMT